MNNNEIDEIETLATLDRSYKDKKEELRISLSEFNGKRFVSVRVFWQNEAGQWLPGKQGCSVRVRELEPVIKALCVAKERIAK